MNIKIATILPYKENYTTRNACIVMGFDFFKYSKLKKNNFIFGSTSSKII